MAEGTQGGDGRAQDVSHFDTEVVAWVVFIALGPGLSEGPLGNFCSWLAWRKATLGQHLLRQAVSSWGICGAGGQLTSNKHLRDFCFLLNSEESFVVMT